MWSAEQSISIPGFMEAEELEWLGQQAARFSTVVEIGCWMGRSTSMLAARCDGTVYTVDHFKGSPSELNAAHIDALTTDIYAEAIKHLGDFPNLKIFRMSSLQASRMFRPGSVDMVFLDGEHTRESLLIDLISWWPKCRRLICGHDRDWEGVQEAHAVYGTPFERGPGSLWFCELIGT